MQKVELNSVRQSVAELSEACVHKEEFSKVSDALKAHQSHISGRIGTIEKGECTSLVTSILNTVEKMSDERFSVFERSMKHFIEISNTDLSRNLTNKVDDATKVLQIQTAGSLSQHKQQIESAFALKMEALEEALRFQILKTGNAVASTYRELLRSKDEVSDLVSKSVAVFRNGQRELSGAVRVLFETFMLDSTTCFNLCGCKIQPQPEVAEFPVRLEPVFDQGLALNHHHGRSANADNDNQLVNVDQLLATIGHLSDVDEERRHALDASLLSTSPLLTLEGASEATEEKKVAYLSRLPQAVNMRFMVQREIGDRIDLLRSEVQHDMVTELLDMQRDLKGKVATTKLHELLDSHRDEQLYNTVKTLVADLQDVRSSKLDIQHFVDALREKADVKLLEAKVDVNDLSGQVDIINNTTERIGRELTKATEKHRYLESNVQNLQQYVMTGGGVYATMAELNGKLASANTVHQQQMKFGGPTAAMSSASFSTDGGRTPRPTLIPTAASRADSEVAASQADELGGSTSYSSMPRGGALTSMASALGVKPTATKSEIILEILKKDEHREESIDNKESKVVGPMPNGDGDQEGCLRDAPDWVSENGGVNITPTKPKSRRPQTGGPVPKQRERGRIGSAGSSKPAVNHHLPGGVLSQSDKSPLPPPLPLPRSNVAAVPMTASQREYCDRLGLDSASTIKILQAATPNVTVGEARGARQFK
eukprot:GILI01014658.1.p1 GENE.GILI01014658.1~~GILI01014658.1.p1  ORF type:complete len:750 (+),score=77.25 GILI01014658.1:117-2252(+)